MKDGNEAALRLREVRRADRDILFQWANDPETRRQAFHTEPIPYEDHIAWFEHVMADKTVHQYLLCRGDILLGQIRLNVEDGRALISYSVSPENRGKGCGAEMLRLLERRIASAPLCGITRLVAQVKYGNIASAKTFEKCGYRKNEMPDYIQYEKCGRIYFRADANGQVGYGHLMRSLTIADACADRGLWPVFVMADEGAAETVEKRGFPCVILHTDYRDMEGEIPALCGALQADTPLVLDSYFLTPGYVKALRERGFRLAWMDDLGEEDYPVDLLINYNLYAPQLGYPKAGDTREAAEHVRGETAEHAHSAKDGRFTRYLLGASYAPVRPAFRTERIQVSGRLQTILVTTGAADPCGAGSFFAETLARLDAEVQILVVCGPYTSDREALHALAKQCGRVSVLEEVTDLSPVMRRSDFAVAAAGSTLYELCAVGVPAMVYYFADNQRQGAEAFSSLTGMANLGDLRAAGGRETAKRRLADAFCAIRGKKARERIAGTMHGLVDGAGADRIAEALAELVFDGHV